MPDKVRTNASVRPVSAMAAVLVCIVGGLFAHNRFGDSNRLSFGFMPISGGSEWSDPAARSGVGTGEAVIAARDHADSFGGVESDIFLESTESTLFDMVNDMIGKPKLNKKLERRQSVAAEQVKAMHERAAKSEQGGSTFSTDRESPKKHGQLRDNEDEAVLQWDGPIGIRLAMERFDTFDGVEWTNRANHQEEQLTRHNVGQ